MPEYDSLCTRCDCRASAYFVYLASLEHAHGMPALVAILVFVCIVDDIVD